jgi:hypothetical protein
MPAKLVPPKMIPRRPTGSTTSKNLTAVYPQEILDRAWAIRNTLDVGRDRILWAATLAVLVDPPPEQVAYPDLNTGPSTCTVPYSNELYYAVRHVGRARFYKRHAWMAYFGMTERYDILIGILRMFTPELDDLEVHLVSTSTAEVIPCPDTPTRAPSSRLPKSERPAKPQAKPKKKGPRKKPGPKPKPKKPKGPDRRKGPRTVERGGWRKKKPTPGTPPTEPTN